MSFAARAVWLVTGLVWAGRSLLEFAHPNYWNPVTTLDWLAVWSFSACWLLLAPSVILLGRLASSRQVMVVAGVVAIGALVAAVANAIEDGLGAKTWGTLYVLGSLTAWLGLLPLALTTSSPGSTQLAKLCCALFGGFLLFPVGGGLISLVAWAILGIAPSHFKAVAKPRLNVDDRRAGLGMEASADTP